MASALANPPRLTPELVQIWTKVLTLAGITPREVEEAAIGVLASERFFPQPAVLIERARPKLAAEADEEIAWQLALHCLQKHGQYASLHADDVAGNGAALWTLSRIGWGRFCRELSSENRALFRAEFVRTYRAARQVSATLDYLAGLQEIQNDARGLDLTPALVGRPDWEAIPASTQPIAALTAPAPVSISELLPKVQDDDQ